MQNSKQKYFREEIAFLSQATIITEEERKKEISTERRMKVVNQKIDIRTIVPETKTKISDSSKKQKKQN